MTNKDAEAEKIVRSAMASTELAGIKDYLQRGRRFERVNAGELSDIYVSAYRSLSEDVFSYDKRIAVSDLDAEYALRKIDRPTDLVTQYINEICEAVSDDMKNLSPEKWVEINNRMRQEFEDEQKKRN
jgi:hypothetical protein